MQARRIWRVVATFAVASLALAVVATALPLPGEQRDATEPMLLASSLEEGELVITNSKQGDPIVTASELVPGGLARGRVELANVGTVPARLWLLKTRMVEGPPGTHLAAALDVKVQRLPMPRQPPPKANDRETLYRGTLAAMPRVYVGGLAPGAARTFRFRVTFLDGGTPPSPTSGDNAYQGTTASVRFAWRAKPPA